MIASTVPALVDLWIHKLLRRQWVVVVVVKFLAEHGLPLRGHSEIIGSATDGNFLWYLGTSF